MKVQLVSMTQIEPSYAKSILDQLPDDIKLRFGGALEDPQGLMAYVARVSSPNQANPAFEGLLGYCLKHNHWSVFEMVDMTFEVETSRMISAQILRHWSFSFQEFSQRYAAVGADGIELYAARRQDNKNRQNSIANLPQEVVEEWNRRQLENWTRAYENYEWALKNDIAKECARAVLPMQTKTKIYMKASVRDWIHYLELRTANGTQAEHMDIAKEIKKQFRVKMPVVATALEW